MSLCKDFFCCEGYIYEQERFQCLLVSHLCESEGCCSKSTVATDSYLVMIWKGLFLIEPFKPTFAVFNHMDKFDIADLYL